MTYIHSYIWLITSCTTWCSAQHVEYQTFQALKAFFSTYGIPSTFISDNGPQFASEEIVTFAHEYNFAHINNQHKSSRTCMLYMLSGLGVLCAIYSSRLGVDLLIKHAFHLVLYHATRTPHRLKPQLYIQTRQVWTHTLPIYVSLVT